MMEVQIYDRNCLNKRLFFIKDLLRLFQGVFIKSSCCSRGIVSTKLCSSLQSGQIFISLLVASVA
ncbi:unnamed protein product [Brassica oleracea]